MKISITENNQPLITGDEVMLSIIEGISVNDVEIPAGYSRVTADKLTEAFQKASYSPNQFKVIDNHVTILPFENIKLYAVLKQRYVSSFNK